MTPIISIIFPTLNQYPSTKKCLASIAKLNYPKNKIEVIVVDNASTDGTPEKLKKLKIKSVKNKKNLGFAKAVNQGAKKAKGQYLFITNNDVILTPDCLKILLAAFLESKKIGLVGPKAIHSSSQKLAIAPFKANPWLGYHSYDQKNPDLKKEVNYLSGCGLFTSSAIFKKMKGFDPNYFFYFEDLDFCLRLMKAGYKIIYEPRALIYHDYAQTALRQKPEKIFFQGYLSRFYCLFKNASWPQIITASFSVSLLALGLEIQNLNNQLIRGKIITSLAKAYFANLKNIGKIAKARTDG